MKKLIGREKEQVILNDALLSGEAEMIAITGRRRVGKTFLIRSVYNEKIDLEFTGVQNAPRREQLDSFHFLLQQFADKPQSLTSPQNWLEAFHQLITVLSEKKQKKKKLILFLRHDSTQSSSDVSSDFSPPGWVVLFFCIRNFKSTVCANTFPLGRRICRVCPFVDLWKE